MTRLSQGAALTALMAALALAGCDKPASNPAAATGPAAPATAATAAQGDDDQRFDERNGPEANETDAASPPAQASSPGGDGQSGVLEAGDQQLRTGQFYDTVEFQAQAGETVQIAYDAQGYQPVFIVMGPDNKVDSQTSGPAPGRDGQARVDDQIRIDRPGVWHALLSSQEAGATGAYRVSISRSGP